MENRNKVIMKSLAEMAWADGQVTDEERAMLLKVCRQLGASPEECKEFREVLGEPGVSFEGELKDVLPDRESRLNVMKVLMTMSFIDGALDFAEFDVIEQKAKELGLDADDLEALRIEALSAAEAFKEES